MNVTYEDIEPPEDRIMTLSTSDRTLFGKVKDGGYEVETVF